MCSLICAFTSVCMIIPTFFFLFPRPILSSAVSDIKKFISDFFPHIKFLYYLLPRQHFIFTFPDIEKFSQAVVSFFTDTEGG